MNAASDGSGDVNIYIPSYELDQVQWYSGRCALMDECTSRIHCLNHILRDLSNSLPSTIVVVVVVVWISKIHVLRLSEDSS